MVILQKILSNINTTEIIGKTHIIIENITADSRQVKHGDLFIAVKGTNVDGHLFINKAIENGAVAVICNDCLIDNPKVTFIKVNDEKKALAIAASNYYDNPSSKMKIVGITGTNGKTTTATTLYNLFLKLGYKTGLISTIANYICDKKIETNHTTPDAIELNSLFVEMLKEGCEYCFMEVSSHAIDQNRVYSIDFDGGIFTNLTHDHLDYHKDFKNYLLTKKTFFDNLKPTAFALTNIDDRNGQVMVQNTKNAYSYSLKTLADFKAKVIERHFDATNVEFNGQELWLQFVGNYNVYNLLAVYACATLLLPDRNDEILQNLSLLKSVNGRFDVVKNNDIFAIIDYAHTPDAVENILKELKSIKNENQKIITVIGAGGDRDKTKRPKMASISAFYSDFLILTSDNPRTENPETIIDEMEKGLDKDANFLRISDRKQAIKAAVKYAEKNDIILIAGKGHETYQEINGVKYHFDDKEEIISQFENCKL